MNFAPEIIEAIKLHANEAFPNESCGFITEAGYVRVTNISSDPENTFRISAEDTVTYANAIAMVHSHPDKSAYDYRVNKRGFYPFCPSKDDLDSQISSGMTWGIVVTDGQNAMEPFFFGEFVLDLPIYGREFRHGVEDCYTIIRKWFWQNRQVKLADFSRWDGWWDTNANLYVNNLAAAGFKRLSSTDRLQEGDCGLMMIGGRNIQCLNHAFIYLGDGTMCHHLPNRISSRDAIGGRMNEINFWARYAGPAA